jgi:hypothetical protein
LAFAFAPSAFADDLSWLTGAQPAAPMNVNGWAGIYIGGQVSYSSAGGDFSNTTQAPLAYQLRETTLENEQQPSSWPVLGQANHSATGFGGFVGYNTQFERLVLGVEANYDQANLSLIAPNSPISRMTSAGGNTYDVTVSGSGSVTDLNFGTLPAGRWAISCPTALPASPSDTTTPTFRRPFRGHKIHKISPVPLRVPRRRHVYRSLLPALPERTANGWLALPSAAVSMSRSPATSSCAPNTNMCSSRRSPTWSWTSTPSAVVSASNSRQLAGAGVAWRSKF